MSDVETKPADEAASPLHETVHDLVDRVEQLEEDKEELKSENEQLREKLDEVKHIQELATDTLWELEDFILGERELYEEELDDDHDILSRIAEVKQQAAETSEVEDVRDDVADARERYSKQAAMLQKRFTALENEIEIDTMDLVTEDDHISRFIANGPEDVFPRVYKKHRRARKMLMNASDWGDPVDDQLGKRVVFKASTVKPFLKTEYDRSFNSTEVKRIFEVVDELGEMSSREVDFEKNAEGEHRLAVWGV